MLLVLLLSLFVAVGRLELEAKAVMIDELMENKSRSSTKTN